MNRKSRIALTFAAAMIVLAAGSKAENSCGVSAITLPDIDTAQIYVWQGPTLEGNPSTSAGVFLTPFATGPVDAIVSVRITLNSATGVPIPLLFVVGDGRGNNFFAKPIPNFLFSGNFTSIVDLTFRVTSAQLYFALWAQGGTPPRYFTGRTKLTLQPRVCDSGRYRAKFDVDSTNQGTNDGTIDVMWEIPSTASYVPFPPQCSKLDRTCLDNIEKWELLWKRRP